MKTRDGYIQGYNGQAAVDAAHQVIVAHGLSNNASDQEHLAPMVDAVEVKAGRRKSRPYCSEANLEALEERRINAHVAARNTVGRRPSVSAKAAPHGSGPCGEN